MPQLRAPGTVTRTPQEGPRPPWRSNAKVWRDLCTQVLAEEHRCYLCGHPVDTSGRVPTNDDWAPTVDHVIPPDWAVFLYGQSLALERANLRLAHRYCNNRKGEGPPPHITWLRDGTWEVARLWPPPPTPPATPSPTSRTW